MTKTLKFVNAQIKLHGIYVVANKIGVQHSTLTRYCFGQRVYGPVVEKVEAYVARGGKAGSGSKKAAPAKKAAKKVVKAKKVAKKAVKKASTKTGGKKPAKAPAKKTAPKAHGSAKKNAPRKPKAPKAAAVSVPPADIPVSPDVVAAE